MPYRLIARAAARATGRLGWLRGAIGAALAIAGAALISRFVLGESASWPWLLAPIGASAVLVFALPASPLAQPWPLVGGNLLSAAVGLAAGHFIHIPALAAAVALAGAIAAMSIARCLHPPGAACALLGTLSGPALAQHGWAGLLVPLALNLLGLVAVACLYNNFTRHAWPHRLPPAVPPPQENRATGYDIADLDAVLENWDEVLDVGRDDLDALFRAVERQVQLRTRGNIAPR